MKWLLVSTFSAPMVLGLAMAMDRPKPLDDSKLAYTFGVGVHAYGPGGTVSASYRCATPEKARALAKKLEAFASDTAPDWDTEHIKEQRP